MLLKKFYKFICKHNIGVIRALYLAPLIVTILNNDYIFKFVIVLCAVISITYQAGNVGKWDREDE